MTFQRFLAIAMMVLLVGGCQESNTQTPATSEPTSGTATPPATGDDSAANAESSDVLVIDVRSQEEWDAGHLETAIHIPHTEIADRIAEVTTDKNAKIVLHCKAGGRAGTAKSTLEAMGYVDVENVGGLEDARSRFQ